MRKPIFIFFALAASAVAQSAPPAAVAAADPTTPGVAMQWDVQKLTSTIAQQVRTLASTLSAAKPEDWSAHGAPDAYVRQLRSTQTQIAVLITRADKLAQDPEKLPVALDTYFLMLDMEKLAGSLAEGVRKYQSPSLADRLTQDLANTAANRDRLRQHITSLAATRDDEFQVMYKEAQRCRGMISRQTDPPARSRRNRTATKGVQP